eukprot:5054284-Pleurochrysis_carterae.AAC.2
MMMRLVRQGIYFQLYRRSVTPVCQTSGSRLGWTRLMRLGSAVQTRIEFLLAMIENAEAPGTAAGTFQSNDGNLCYCS